MKSLSLSRMVGAAAVLTGCATLPAQAAIVTISGPNFDLSYDEALLGPYGTPSVVGNSVFFTSGAILAQRFVTGTTEVSTMLRGLVITMRDSLSIDSLTVSVLGDYFLEVAEGSVTVGGLLEATDATAPASSRTGAALTVDPATPLTTVGANTDWRASAAVDRTTAVAAGQSNVFQSGARSIGLSLGTELTASLGASAGGGLREAFIEQKFAGLQLVVSPRGVAAPGTLSLLLAAAAVALLLRRP